jgi:hypothetical protein
MISGRRITVGSYEALDLDPADTLRQIDQLVKELEQQ